MTTSLQTKNALNMLLAGVQWLFFLFTNTVMVPLSIGHALGLEPGDIAASMQRSFILTGLLCIVQIVWGHRYALMDGPAGVWWGLVLSITASAPAMGMDAGTVAASLMGGFLLSSMLVIVLALCGFITVLKRIFSPIVMGVFLLLLTFQLANTFFKGMIGYDQQGKWDLQIAGLSLCIMAVVAIVHLRGKGKLGQFSLLIGIGAGWAAFAAIFGTDSRIETTGAGTARIWEWMPWGTPGWEPGILLVGLLAGLVNMTNTITSLTAASKLFQREAAKHQYIRSVLFTNGFSIIGACFGLIPFGTFASSIGFLENTKVLRRAALFVGAALFIVIGAFPVLSGWLVQLPMSVGSAVLFVAYLQMFGTAFRTIQGTAFNAKTIYRIALPVLTGISIMNIPSSAFTEFPPLLMPILSNGLVIGVMMVIVLENVVRWEKYETKALMGAPVSSKQPT
ncbi:Xanthine/uracil/vitamin C permease [Paenibacillus curdlanolyticus YK9]|uniref:Xanthine/uracil/vitamin C permease n=1 Tax=Paenibacillus curdlanolyticus YK9 TaxID=717606 RepID=E0IG91_9BACL|nr:uracil/xanthine transporter [Paenibacillus curdlanolyticus]EFM08493.1 Xanthine/uracil/vitamin C permease [Paenibacillus curdlanolyticus YK9]